MWIFTRNVMVWAPKRSYHRLSSDLLFSIRLATDQRFLLGTFQPISAPLNRSSRSFFLFFGERIWSVEMRYVHRCNTHTCPLPIELILMQSICSCYWPYRNRCVHNNRIEHFVFVGFVIHRKFCKSMCSCRCCTATRLVSYDIKWRVVAVRASSQRNR